MHLRNPWIWVIAGVLILAVTGGLTALASVIAQAVMGAIDVLLVPILFIALIIYVFRKLLGLGGRGGRH